MDPVDSGSSPVVPTKTGGESWTISFDNPTKRKKSKREKIELEKQQQLGAPVASTQGYGETVVHVSDLPVDVEALVPRNLPTTQSDLLNRVHFDIPRLLCIAKQYPRSCGVTSLTSVWNLLYSRIGHGSLPPVSQEEVMTILGFAPPFDSIHWGPFTGNVTLLRWFHCLNRHFNVQGKAYFLWKVHGHGRTPGVSADRARVLVQESLRNPKAAIIYHCHNHYMLPIGFQMIPRHQTDCYKPQIDDADAEMTVFVGEVSRGKHPAMHTVKWKDIVTDLSTVHPNYFNIRNAHLGVQVRGGATKKKGAKSVSASASVVDGDGAPSVGGDDASPQSAVTAAQCQGPSVIAVEKSGDGSLVCEAPAAATAPPPRRTPGNLHCLLVFRADMVEEDLSRYEEASGSGSDDDAKAKEQREDEEDVDASDVDDDLPLPQGR